MVSRVQSSCLVNPHAQRNLAGYSLQGCKESDTIVWLSTQHRVPLILRLLRFYSHHFSELEKEWITVHYRGDSIWLEQAISVDDLTETRTVRRGKISRERWPQTLRWVVTPKCRKYCDPQVSREASPGLDMALTLEALAQRQTPVLCNSFLCFSRNMTIPDSRAAGLPGSCPHTFLWLDHLSYALFVVDSCWLTSV